MEENRNEENRNEENRNEENRNEEKKAAGQNIQTIEEKMQKWLMKCIINCILNQATRLKLCVLILATMNCEVVALLEKEES